MIFFWLFEYNERVILYVDILSSWSKIFFLGYKDCYEEFCYLKFRKIMFYIIFNYGFLGFFGVMISEEKFCVVLMVRGGVLVCVYENIYLVFILWVLNN